MRTFTIYDLRFTVLTALLLAAFNVSATLTAVVTPGYQFPNDGSVPPTPALLNLLALPTIQIYGTIGGSNTLDPGSVNGVELADSVPDGGTLNLPVGVTMGWNTASPRQLAVNTAGIVDGNGGIESAGTNALYLMLDPTYFLLSTNSLGTSTNVNTGSVTNWLTLKPNTLGDTNIAQGGLTAWSINSNGLPPSVISTPLLLTNIFFSGTITNVYTNNNTVVIGGTNGLGKTVLFGPGFSLSTTSIVTSAVSGGVTNFATNTVPIFQLASIGPAAELAVNVTPFTNSAIYSGSGVQTYTSAVYSVTIFGGTPPYTNNWQLISSNVTNFTLNGAYITSTNAASTQIVSSQSAFNTPAYVNWYLQDTLIDGSGQRSQFIIPAVFNVHVP